MGKVHNNYFSCYYNNDFAQVVRREIHDKWGIHFNIPSPISPKSLKEETLQSCQLMYDAFKKDTPILNLFFSGGMDSECMLRCFHELKIPVNPITIVHYYEPNAPEIVNAMAVCKQLNITPTIINMNFYELFASGKLHSMGIKYQTARMGMLELLYVLEQIGAPCILADDIQLTYHSTSKARLEDGKSEWLYEIREDEDGVFDRYQHISGIPLIADSFRYTPQSWAALILTPHIQEIVLNDRGKMSSHSTKNIMMSHEFQVPYREKTNIFLEGNHRKIVSQLKRDLRQDILEHSIIRIPYRELLKSLKVQHGI